MGSKRKELHKTSLGTIGSGNVFADLGLPDADELLLKSRLVGQIDDAIERHGLTEAEASSIMGLPESKVYELRRFKRINDYSVEHLCRLLKTLGARFGEAPDDLSAL